MNPYSNHVPSPRRAHFSRHETDRPSGIDETLYRAAIADQASLQQEHRQEPSSSRRLSSANTLSPTSPFLPGYSLTVPSTGRESAQREQLARPVSPLQVPRQHVLDRAFTESPAIYDSLPPQRQAPLSPPEGHDEEEDSSDVPWMSCRDRRPTSAIIPSLKVGDESVSGGQSVGSQGLLGSRRPSLHMERSKKPAPLNLGEKMPRLPAQAYPQAQRATSEGMLLSRDKPNDLRASNGSADSIHGSTPHIQRYDPLSSPSMVRLYSPRAVSGNSRKHSALKSPSNKPPPTRLNQSSETCELGLAGMEQEEETHHSHLGGLRNALTGLYERVVSSDYKSHQHDQEDDTFNQDPERPTMRRRSSAQSQGSTTATSRRSSEGMTWDEAAPSLSYLNRRRKSMAFILGEDDEPKEQDDPRFTGMGRKSVDKRRQYDFMNSHRASYTSEHFDGEVLPRKRALSLANIVAPLKDFGSNLEKQVKPDNNHRSLQSHMAERQKFILKLARALMLFGAPSHRVESQLNALSQVLAIDGQYIHFPGIVIASFGDIDHHTSECHFVKSKTELALGHLNEIHTIYKGVITDQMTVHEATKDLNRLLKAKPEWSILSRVAFNAIRCGIIAPMSFGGSFIDMFLAGTFGGALTFTQLYFAGNSPMFSNVFEISAAIVISFLARLLSVQSVFCYQAVASAGLILVLPGYIILCGSLELASKNMIAGSVRLVYAIIYSLFLGFGIAIGSDLYFVFDPKARRSIWLPLNTQTEVQGSFTFANETMPHWSGQFTFTNGTKNALNTGSINCERLPEWPWYRQPLDPLFNIFFVPLFAFLGCFSLLHPFKSREVPVSVIIACVGYVTNLLANHYIFGRSDVVSAIGSFAIGILGNAYSRIYNATAFTAMTVAVLFLVPSGMAMAGGLAMTYKGSDGDLYSNGLAIGLRMVQVSIGITTGLFASALFVYMLGNKRKNAHLFAF